MVRKGSGAKPAWPVPGSMPGGRSAGPSAPLRPAWVPVASLASEFCSPLLIDAHTVVSLVAEASQDPDGVCCVVERRERRRDDSFHLQGLWSQNYL